MKSSYKHRWEGVGLDDLFVCVIFFHRVVFFGVCGI